MTLFHTPKTTIYYSESLDEDHPEGMAVEIGDVVEWQHSTDWGIASYDGEITEIMPRKGAAKVVYEDGHDVTRAGDPRRKVITLPITMLTLMGRAT